MQESLDLTLKPSETELMNEIHWGGSWQSLGNTEYTFMSANFDQSDSPYSSTRA